MRKWEGKEANGKLIQPDSSTQITFKKWAMIFSSGVPSLIISLIAMTSLSIKISVRIRMISSGSASPPWNIEVQKLAGTYTLQTNIYVIITTCSSSMTFFSTSLSLLARLFNLNFGLPTISQDAFLFSIYSSSVALTKFCWQGYDICPYLFVNLKLVWVQVVEFEADGVYEVGTFPNGHDRDVVAELPGYLHWHPIPLDCHHLLREQFYPT